MVNRDGVGDAANPRNSEPFLLVGPGTVNERQAGIGLELFRRDVDDRRQHW